MFALRQSVRSYATAASRQLRLTLACPHQVFVKSQDVHQVNLSSSQGDLGILADHVPVVAQLRPGVVEILSVAGDSKPQKFFVSGGFAVMNPDSTLSINAVEANPLSELDFDAAKKAIEESNRKLSSPEISNDAVAKASVKAELEVFEAVVAAANKK